MELVILESPYAADTPEGVSRNEQYARACMKDCLRRGEAPFASHLLYTQPGVLDDTIKSERALGIKAGLHWGQMSKKTVVYTDLGVSRGMEQGIEHASEFGRRIEFRKLGWTPE